MNMMVSAIDLSEPTDFGVEIQRNALLAPYTTMKIGGPAEYFATVATVDQLLKLVRWARRIALPYYMLGGGSNILISDAGIRGLVVYNRCRAVRLDEAPCCVFPVDDRPFLFAESGAAMAGLARRSVTEGLTGLEWAVSVPGTVGGAVVGNAGAHGMEVKDNLYDALVLDEQGDVVEIFAEDLHYTYRASELKREIPTHSGFGSVVLSANFRLARGDAQAIRAQADVFLQHRRRTQPVEPSLGSTFKNPPGDYAGRLIEAAGLKGARVNDVEISAVHANFIVNPSGVGGARAADVLELMQQIQHTVAEQFGVQLELEVQLVGEW